MSAEQKTVEISDGATVLYDMAVEHIRELRGILNYLGILDDAVSFPSENTKITYRDALLSLHAKCIKF